MSSPALNAARAILARITEVGGVNNLGHLEAHELLRRAFGVAETGPNTWQATRAALNAAAGGDTDPTSVARAITTAHETTGDAYPADLYGAAQIHKPSQWVSPARRRELLARSGLGRTVLGHRPNRP